MAISMPTDGFSQLVLSFIPDFWPQANPDTARAVAAGFRNAAQAAADAGTGAVQAASGVQGAWSDSLGQTYAPKVQAMDSGPNGAQELASGALANAAFLDTYADKIDWQQWAGLATLAAGAVAAYAGRMLPPPAAAVAFSGAVRATVARLAGISARNAGSLVHGGMTTHMGRMSDWALRKIQKEIERKLAKNAMPKAPRLSKPGIRKVNFDEVPEMKYFPDAKVVGKTKDGRPVGRTNVGDIVETDKGVEVYRNGHHMGTYHPQTGKMLENPDVKRKPPW